MHPFCIFPRLLQHISARWSANCPRPADHHRQLFTLLTRQPTRLSTPFNLHTFPSESGWIRAQRCNGVCVCVSNGSVTGREWAAAAGLQFNDDRIDLSAFEYLSHRRRWMFLLFFPLLYVEASDSSVCCVYRWSDGSVQCTQTGRTLLYSSLAMYRMIVISSSFSDSFVHFVFFSLTCLFKKSLIWD